MIRNHEKPIAMRAGLLTLLVHLLLGLLLVFSFQWKSIQPMQIATVELWDSLPNPPAVLPEKAPEAEKPVEPVKPIEAEKPVIEEKPVLPEKVEIQLKPKPEKPKPEPDKSKAKEKPEDQLKKLQAALLNEATEFSKQEKPKAIPTPTSVPTPPAPSPAAEVKSTVAVTGSTTDTSEMAKYIGLITAQIKQHVNHEVCGSNKTELQYVIQLLPSGMLIGKPQLQSSNASAACNDAVERAILQAQPLKVPSGDLFNQFRSLKLKFKPNE